MGRGRTGQDLVGHPARGRAPESLGMALAGATGVSGGSAHTVPALLMTERVGGRRLTELTDLISLEDDRLGDNTCYRFSGRYAPLPVDPDAEKLHRDECIRVTGRPPERSERGPQLVWVDRESLLIRRIEEMVQFETFQTATVTEYDPAAGITITEDELRFDAPCSHS